MRAPLPPPAEQPCELTLPRAGGCMPGTRPAQAVRSFAQGRSGRPARPDLAPAPRHHGGRPRLLDRRGTHADRVLAPLGGGRVCRDPPWHGLHSVPGASVDTAQVRARSRARGRRYAKVSAPYSCSARRDAAVATTPVGPQQDLRYRQWMQLNPIVRIQETTPERVRRQRPRSAVVGSDGGRRLCCPPLCGTARGVRACVRACVRFPAGWTQNLEMYRQTLAALLVPLDQEARERDVAPPAGGEAAAAAPVSKTKDKKGAWQQKRMNRMVRMSADVADGARETRCRRCIFGRSGACGALWVGVGSQASVGFGGPLVWPQRGRRHAHSAATDCIDASRRGHQAEAGPQGAGARHRMPTCPHHAPIAQELLGDVLPTDRPSAVGSSRQRRIPTTSLSGRSCSSTTTCSGPRPTR